MKPNAVVYGLGKYYEVRKNKIRTKYHIIGHCDQKIKFSEVYQDFVSPTDLCNIDFDFIIITSISYKEIIKDLVEKHGISCNKILIWMEEERKQDYFNRYGIQYAFGQFGEDYVISKLLREKNIPESKATYIEIGVDEPFLANHTFFLHLAGASGILVDANPESINLIKVSRKKQKVINKVVSDKKEKMSFFISATPALSSLSIENINLNRGTVKQEVMIDSISVNDVLAMQDKTAVLSIDVEGYDEIVLKSIDLSKYQPEIICAEVGKPTDELIDYMETKGYKLDFCNYINAIWKRL